MIAGHLEAEDGHRYHLDPAGDDLAGDGSAARPWRSLARLVTQRLGPGDTVLLRGGGEYPGQLEIGPGQGGDERRPLVITSSGEGRARIRATADLPAIRIRDAGSIELRGLDVRGPGGTLSHSAGLELQVTGATRHSHIRLARIEVAGFAVGVEIRAGSAAGFDDLVLDHVDSHANGDCGILIQAPAGTRSHRRVSIAHCRAWDNGCGQQVGLASGAGIMLDGVEDARIEYCETWGNGGQLRAGSASGGVGIRCGAANRVTLQRCISHHNRGGGPTGGAGFELAAGAQDCVLQYLYAYSNSGPGIRLVDGSAPGDGLRGNLVRFVLSQDDARRNGCAGLSVLATGRGIVHTLIHNATVYLSPAPEGTPVALRIQGPGVDDLRLEGNAFMTEGMPLLHCERVQGLRLRGNAYCAPGAAVHWGGMPYPDPDTWLAAVDQERCDGRRVAVCGELVLERPGRAAPLADPQSLGALVAYRPRCGSPLSAGGIDPALRGYPLGGRDLCGLALDDDQALIGAFAPAPAG